MVQYWIRHELTNRAYKNKDVLTYLENHQNKYKKVVKQKKDQEIINTLVTSKNLNELKDYTEKNPNSVYYIEDESLRLALTGPKDIKVGDIRKLTKDGEDEIIILSLIKRVKVPYKEFTVQEIKILKKMGLSSKVISTMMDVTTELLKDKRKREQQKFFISEQKRVKKDRTSYSNTQNKTVDSQGNPIVERVQQEVIKQGVGMLLDRLF